TISPPPTSTLFPYTTLFRSHSFRDVCAHPSALVRVVDHLSVPHAYTSQYHLRDSHQDSHNCKKYHLIPPFLHVSRRKDGSSDRRSEEHTSELQSRFDLVCRL